MSNGGSSRLGLSDLRNEQATLLHRMEATNANNDTVFSPSIKQRAKAATAAAEAAYSTKSSVATPTGVAALQARTSALNAELEFHKDLLNQLLTPPGKPSSRALGTDQKGNTNVPASVRRGTYWGTYTPQQHQHQHQHQRQTPASPTILDTKTHDALRQSTISPTTPPTTPPTTHPPQRNNPTVGDAYGSLLNELQAVRQQVSRFVETANVSPFSNLRMPEHTTNRFEGGRSNDGSNDPNGNNGNHGNNSTNSTNSNNDDENRRYHYDQNYDANEMGNDPSSRRQAKQARNNAMKKYRALLLEEREKIIDDLESRVSKNAMRSSRDIVRNSRLNAREIDALHKASRSKRRTKQQKMAEECFAEVHSVLRTMRDELDAEKRKAETELRNTFHQDRDAMINEMKTAVAKEREEHIKRLVNELSDTKRLALEHQRSKMNESLQLEVSNMQLRLQEEHTPALQTFREGALEKRTEVLAQEELRMRLQLDSELSVLRSKLDQETRKAVNLQRMRMVDEHRRRSEDLTEELLQRHEQKLREDRTTMTKLHQLEQEVVMKELSEALHFGMTNALEEHAIVLRRETDVEIQSIRKANEEKQQQELNDLTNQLKKESEHALHHLKQASIAELDVLQSRLRGEAAADHAAKVNRLQIQNASQRSRKENEFKQMYHKEYMDKSMAMDLNLTQDISEALDSNELLFSQKLKLDLDKKRKIGEQKQAAMLVQMERNFAVELVEMEKMMSTFFNTNRGGGGSGGSSSAHMPTTKRAIQQRLANMTEQFETYKSKYKRAANDLGKLQNEIIDLRQKLRTTMRALDNSEQRNKMLKGTKEQQRGGGGHGGEWGEGGVVRGKGGALDQSVHDLYSANQRLIDRVTRSSTPSR